MNENAPDSDLVNQHHSWLSDGLKAIEHAVLSSEIEEVAACRAIEAIDTLTVLTLFQFASEERLMEEVAYPDLAAHTDAHARIREHLEAMETRARREPLAVARELPNLLFEWLAGHARIMDRPLCDFLRG